MLKALLVYSAWVYVNETKRKKRRKFYWFAVDEGGRSVRGMWWGGSSFQ